MSAWTYIAQRATTREFLDWDVPINTDGPEWQLSATGSLSGTVAPDVGGLRASDGDLVLDEWGTFIYAESGGQIRWAGIVIKCSFEGDAWSLECAGFSTYAHGLPYEGDFSEIGIDPVDAFKEIWRHIQSYPDSNLDVAITGASSSAVKLGTDAYDETVTNDDGSTSTVHHDAEPYQLVWWEHPDCGDEIDNLTTEGRFDWVEHHYWNADKSDVIHEIQVAYPRLGTRRADLLFDEGVNVTNVLSVESNGDEFANGVTGLGSGEGQAMLRRDTAIRDGRLRRVSVYADKSITSTDRMDALIADELNRRKAALRITELDVIDHPNARIGSWQIGDDVKVRAFLPWIGDFEIWVRITGWTLTGEDRAKLTVQRSDLFTYGG